MSEAKIGAVDLFGDPIRESRDGPGRPAHEWTLENSNKINLIFATGGEIADAAAVLGITQPTLRKHYFSELEQWRVARLRLKASLLARLFAEGQKGNVGAIKEIFKQIEKGELDTLSKAVANRRPGRAPAEPKAPRPAPIGKKAGLEQAAEDVEGIYAPPAPPERQEPLPITKH